MNWEHLSIRLLVGVITIDCMTRRMSECLIYPGNDYYSNSLIQEEQESISIFNATVQPCEDANYNFSVWIVFEIWIVWGTSYSGYFWQISEDLSSSEIFQK